MAAKTTTCTTMLDDDIFLTKFIHLDQEKKFSFSISKMKKKKV